MLRNSFSEYFAKNCTPENIKEVIQSEEGFLRKTWKDMAKLGWLGLNFEEKYGGTEGTFLDLFILFEEIGKVLLPSPFFTSAVLSGFLIKAAGNDVQKNKFLAPLVKGKMMFTLACLDSQGNCGDHAISVKAERKTDGAYLLEGTRFFVPYANVADKILVCADVVEKGQIAPTLFLIDKQADTLQIDDLKALGIDKECVVQFKNTRVSQDDIIGQIGAGHTWINKMFPIAIVLKCAEMVGGMQRVLDMTVAYTKQRHQFGRPLGAFQAVQHHCADMATYVESARMLAYQAAYLIDEGLPCSTEVAMAKAWCSDSYKKCTWIGHQLHGAYGFTEESDMHLYYKHAKASELMFGHSWHHRHQVAQTLNI
jgi:alkylation response protein AidB-like acyl-CoA dehydrogenase